MPDQLDMERHMDNKKPQGNSAKRLGKAFCRKHCTEKLGWDDEKRAQCRSRTMCRELSSLINAAPARTSDKASLGEGIVVGGSKCD